jgi:hypothetical protein
MTIVARVPQLKPDTVILGALPHLGLDVTAKALSDRAGIRWDESDKHQPSTVAVVQLGPDEPVFALEADSNQPDAGVEVLSGPELTDGAVVRLLDALSVDDEDVVDLVTGRPYRERDRTREDMVLDIVRAQPGITVPEVADRLGTTPGGSLYRVVGRLSERGVVRKDKRELQPLL